ncbi:GrpB family protein [Alkalicella caledoniensis]|uniref:GrpB family protein n=2 Tax=Alkalicella caledoniensis TaxID=2731377 RepID=A0A7G9W6E6_ALKCA|nr:GrpB family protein [Alkalicella caledoniensis]
MDEEKLLNEIIGKENIVRVNHIGSTSVNGLLAKPTVDILLEIDNHCDVEEVIAILEENGYICMAKQKLKPLNLTLVKGYTEKGFAKRVYHIHIRHFGDWNELYFRDYLKANNDVATHYGNLKMSLKEEYQYDRDAYTNAKSEFILKHTDIARNMLNDKYKK